MCTGILNDVSNRVFLTSDLHFFALARVEHQRAASKIVLESLRKRLLRFRDNYWSEAAPKCASRCGSGGFAALPLALLMPSRRQGGGGAV